MAERDINIIVYNTHLMPWFVPVWELHRFDASHRSVAIGKALGPYDVVGLNEAWQNNWFNNVCRGMRDGKKTKLYAYYDKDGATGSGLGAISKTSLKKCNLLHFKEKGTGWDARASKGAMHIRIGTERSDIDLFISHLQSGSGEKERAARLKQIRELVGFVKKQSSETTPTIIMGDLNINGKRDSAEYKSLVEEVGKFGPMVDAWFFKHADFHATTFNEKTYRWGSSRLDYMFVSDPRVKLPKNPSVLVPRSVSILALKCEPKTGYCTAPTHKRPPACTLSDHAAVAARFSWQDAA